MTQIVGWSIFAVEAAANLMWIAPLMTLLYRSQPQSAAGIRSFWVVAILGSIVVTL